MGAAATVGVALLVAGSALRDDSTTGVTQTLSGGDTAATSEAAPQSAAPFQDAAGGSAGASGDEDAARSSKQAAPGTVLPEPAPTAPDTLRRDRKVERGVELTLRVGAGQLEEAADGVVRTTQRLGGYVADSQVAARERGGSASFTLRIPTKRLDAATSQLSKLGHIVALDQSSRDITGAFVSAEEQLSDARAERKALLRALANATTPGHIASLRARIRLNRSEIAQYKGQLAALRRRADLATITSRSSPAARPRPPPAAVATGRPATPPGTPCACSRSPQASCSSHWPCSCRCHCSACWASSAAARHAGAGAKVPWTPPDRVEPPLWQHRCHRGTWGYSPRSRSSRASGGRPRARGRRRRPRSYDAGQVIFRKDDESDTCYVVRRPRPRDPAERRRPHDHAGALRPGRLLRRAGDVRRRAALGDGRGDRRHRRRRDPRLRHAPPAARAPGHRRQADDRARPAAARGQRAAGAPVLPDRPEPRRVRARPARRPGPARGRGERPTCSSPPPRPTSPSSPAPRGSRPRASSPCSSAPGSSRQGRGKLTVHDPARWSATSSDGAGRRRPGVLRRRRGRARRRRGRDRPRQARGRRLAGRWRCPRATPTAASRRRRPRRARFARRPASTAELVEKLGDVDYWYQRKGRRIPRRSAFFRFDYRGGRRRRPRPRDRGRALDAAGRGRDAR